MKQFYETYKDDEFVTPLVTQISWTNHLLIMSGSKTAEERYFYMALCAKEHYSKRELERQIGTSYYERSMISAKKPMPESVSHDVRESILDTYVLEFLDLPEQFSEKNLRKARTIVLSSRTTSVKTAGTLDAFSGIFSTARLTRRWALLTTVRP